MITEFGGNCVRNTEQRYRRNAEWWDLTSLGHESQCKTYPDHYGIESIQSVFPQEFVFENGGVWNDG